MKEIIKWRGRILEAVSFKKRLRRIIRYALCSQSNLISQILIKFFEGFLKEN